MQKAPPPPPPPPAAPVTMARPRGVDHGHEKVPLLVTRRKPDFMISPSQKMRDQPSLVVVGAPICRCFGVLLGSVKTFGRTTPGARLRESLVSRIQKRKDDNGQRADHEGQHRPLQRRVE